MTQKHHKIKSRTLVLLSTFLVNSYCIAQNNEFDMLLNLSLENLLDVSVSSASGVEETLRDAPAAMVIITSTDIKQRGYTSIDEVIVDLPGFDSTVTNGNGGVIT